ncbi:PD-(D/E)XK nuclease family protein [Porphyromonas sp.]|uniref:PD-(D/E)XK nuclease family protein n=1 Tax=Porphyromonas sp. TaxID=1924944 RepID=UPI003990E912
MSPSMVAGQGRAELLYDSGERIPRIGQASDSLVGDCIHQLFSSTDMQDSEAMAQLVSAYQLQGHLTSVEALQRSWSHFVEFLRTQYGEPTALRHELPFKQQVGKQVITGSIDMLWETAEGAVLIDFKTYSGTTQQLLDPTNPHYAGRYKGQLDCYQRAIEASGQRVLDQLIFYPILGDVVRLLPLD